MVFDYGIAACAPAESSYTYQWDYPNGWANLHFIAIEGLLNYGYKKDAKRIASKYVNTVVKVFKSTGNLWEKYIVVNGTQNVNKENAIPTLLGCTAGVSIYVSTFIAQ